MVVNEGPGDIIVNAFKFSVSNIASLAIWGIAFVLAIIVTTVIMFSGVILFYHNTALLIALVLLSYLPVLAVGVLMVGFMSQCLKTVINGGSVMPTGLESPGALVKDGIMTLIIAFEAFVVEMICFVPIYLLMFYGAYNDNTALTLVSLLLMLLAIPVVMVISFLNMIQWAIYADTGSLLRGLNPLRALGLIRSNLSGAAIMVLLLIGAYVVFAVLLFMCEILIITILLIPFLAIAMYGCIAYIIAVFYRQSIGGQTGAVQNTTAPGYNVT